MAEHERLMDSVPEEVWFHVISYLTAIQDILHLACTCRRLNELTNQNVIWRRRFKGNNNHLLLLPRAVNINNVTSRNGNSQVEGAGVWKKLYLKASHALSFGNRHVRGRTSEVCAEFVANPSTAGTGIRFDHNAPTEQSLEIWVRLNTNKPGGVIIGCQSESISSSRWPQYHWQILHAGPDGCIRGSLEPYKFMKGPCINDSQWHHVALTASSDLQHMYVDGEVVCSTKFGVGHELHRYHMRHSQIGNGMISYGACTPWGEDAMPKGLCGWYPFHGMVREVRIWSGLLSETEVRQNMHIQRIDFLQQISNHRNNCALIGYWPMNRLVSGPWPWQGSLVSCTSHLEEHRENSVHLRIVCSSLV